MKINLFLLLNLFFIVFFTFSKDSKDDFYLKNIILLEKDIIIPNSIDDIVYRETKNAIDILIFEGLINTIPKDKWIFYKKYLVDLDNKENLNYFFLITNIWGIVNINIVDKIDSYLIQLQLIDNFDDFFYLKEFYLSKYNLLNNIQLYKEFVKENIKIYFKKINIKEYLNKISNKRGIIKENKTFEILLSIGNGFFMGKNASFFMNLGFGFPIYSNFDFSFKNFYLGIGFSYFSIFNEPLKIEEKIYNDKIFTFFVSSFLETGGWFYNRFFSFSFGIKYNFSKIFDYIKIKDGNYYSYDYIDFYYFLLFFYFKFIFSPIKNFSLSLKIGSFFSPSHISRIFFIKFFPFYIDVNLKYFFYKDTFIEIIVPFWLESFKQDRDNNEMVFPKFMFQIGLGYRFKWDTK